MGFFSLLHAIKQLKTCLRPKYYYGFTRESRVMIIRNMAD